jgi:patatin-like phospholipase/acyl hydrolase
LTTAAASSPTSTPPRRVLAIDGGGLKGIFPAALLAALEEEIDGSIASHFDLIAGTSTGGILALGLGLGYSARQMLDFYKELGPQVFLKPRGLLGRLRRPKYDPESLRNALARRFEQKTIGDSRTRLVIPSLVFKTGEIYIYKTAHHERLQKDYRIRALDVAMATAAAPTFFPAYRDAAGLPLIDGGVWANNPVACAAVEAVGLLQWPTVHILSLGCTESPLDIHGARMSGDGLTYWAEMIKEFFFRGQSTGALGMAQHLVGHENLVRVSPVFPTGRYELDRVDDSLPGIAAAEARKEIGRLRTMFLRHGHVEPFVPVWPKSTPIAATG